ncbi:MAG TPA: ATP-binding protein [Ktedonobacteraceae bacterium]|jgi:DNA polymerase III delta prime subunit|nr:ATP-binding protein [Ktedonobacteraceae bacterium]
MAFKKAVKYGSFLRMAIAGPAGSGKTWTALTLASVLAGEGEIAVIDTEHGSASKYADQFLFDTQELTNFNPNNYMAAIKEAEQAGYAVLIIDSLSHAWTGSGGLMEQKDIIAKQKYSNNGFSAWLDAGKIQNNLVNTILSSKMHIIVTVRSKMEYVVEPINGKQTPRKVGLAPVQRDDLPYEFDVFATMENDNTMIVDKSRCPQLSGQVIAKPGAEVATVLKAWLDGEPAPELPAPALAQEPTPIPARTVNPDGPATEQQIATIGKLQKQLGEEPANLEGLGFEDCAALLREYNQRLQEKRKSA